MASPTQRQEVEQTLGDSEGQRTVRWHHQLNRQEFEQTLGDSEGQRRLVGYSLRGHKESDTT